MSKIRFPLLVRTVHLYVSMLASIGIAFFALSGFVANIRDVKATSEIETVPEAALSSHMALAEYVQSRLKLPSKPTIDEVGTDILAVTVELGDEQIDVTVYRSTRALSLTHWRPLPPDLALDRPTLLSWFSQRLSQPFSHGDEEDDPSLEQVMLTSESVWQTDTITIERPSRRWQINTTKHLLSRTLTDLHTGHNANWWQRRIMDGIAIILVMSVVTGVMLGLCWIVKFRRRVLTISALCGGLLCFILMIIGR